MSYQNIEYNANLALGGNSGAITTTTGSDNSRRILTGENDAMLLFYIPLRDPQRKKYKDKIMQHGGIITESEPTPTNNIILLSSQPLPHKASFKPRFIDDCIATQSLVDLSAYRHNALMLDSNRNKQPKTHTKFNDEKDDFILEEVRKNPRKRNSHAFFDRLAELEPLSSHSGNSIRSRYRVHLRDKLKYVYKTDINDELITDENGNYIRLAVNDFPYTLKNRFTANDDYMLCKEIFEYNRQKNINNFDPYGDLTVPISFFGDFMRIKEAKGHTPNSWRDRYRKFICKYGVKRYIDYYESCIKDNNSPKPITKPNEILEIKSLIGSSYSSKSPDSIYDTKDMEALDEEIGEIKSSNIDNALIEHDQQRRQVRQQKQLQIQAAEAVKVAERSMSPNAMGEFESQQSHYVGGESDSQFDTQSSEVTIKYIPKSAHMEDLLNSNLFKYANPNAIIAEIHNILEYQKEKDTPYLFTSLKDIGFNEVLTSHIIMCTNGDVVRMMNFLEYFLKQLYDTIDAKTITSEELYDILRLKNVNGVWCEDYDVLLDTRKESKLLDVHSKSQIIARKNFLKNIIS